MMRFRPIEAILDISESGRYVFRRKKSDASMAYFTVLKTEDGVFFQLGTGELLFFGEFYSDQLEFAGPIPENQE